MPRTPGIGPRVVCARARACGVGGQATRGQGLHRGGLAPATCTYVRMAYIHTAVPSPLRRAPPACQHDTCNTFMNACTTSSALCCATGGRSVTAPPTHRRRGGGHHPPRCCRHHSAATPAGTRGDTTCMIHGVYAPPTYIHTRNPTTNPHNPTRRHEVNKQCRACANMDPPHLAAGGGARM